MTIRSLYTSILFLFIVTNAWAQNVRSVVKKEKLNTVKFITDIAPGLWDNMIMPYNDRVDLNYLKKATYPETFFCSSNYNTIINYISVEILVTSGGKRLSALGLNDKLTNTQKKIISISDLGTDVIIKVRFKHKGHSKYITNKEIIEGELPVTVVPYIEAEFLDGTVQVEDYLLKKIAKIKDPKNTQPPVVKFAIDEEGKIINVKMEQTSNSTRIDKILLEAITNMPKWKPAKNSKGVTVKQEFCIQLGGGC